MMLPNDVVNVVQFENAIQTRHHYYERFFDIEVANQDRDENLEILNRIKNGVASDEDISKAQSIIANPLN